jgi:uncharacterized protein
MRVVLDTNVFISAALKKRTPPETAVHLAAASHFLLKSTITERELFVTLARPRLAPLIPPHFLDWLHELMVAAELVKISERIAACRDPKDDKFLELAVSGHADVLVTGGRRSARAQSVSRHSRRYTRRLRTGRYAIKRRTASRLGRIRYPPKCGGSRQNSA